MAPAVNAVRDVPGNGNHGMPATPVINAVGATPTVTGVAFYSNPTGNVYAIDDIVDVAVTFSEAIDITGAPQLELDFAGTPKTATCEADTNIIMMLCDYEVVAGDSAPSGVAIAANKLTLNGGAITATGSTTAVDLDHAAVATDAGQKVDGIRPTLVTTGSDAPRTSTDGTKVILTFSEAIGSVDRTYIAIFHSGGVIVPTSDDSFSGRTVEITLATALTDSITNIAVDLGDGAGAGAVRDAAGNVNAQLLETPVTNAVGTAPTVVGVSVAPSSITITEGTSGEYTVVLAGEPSAYVRITFSVAGNVTVSPSSLTFTASTWNTVRTVTVSAPQDSDGNQEFATIDHVISSGSAPEYVALLSGSIGSVQVTVRDDDIPGVVITPAQMTMAEGSTSTYTVALALRPSSRVTISLQPQSVGTTGRSVHLNTYRLSFTTSNWNRPQTVTVEARHDDDGNEDVVPIRHKIVGSASASEYRNVSIDSVDVTVTDGDAQPVAVLSIGSSSTAVNEGGSFVI